MVFVNILQRLTGVDTTERARVDARTEVVSDALRLVHTAEVRGEKFRASVVSTRAELSPHFFLRKFLLQYTNLIAPSYGGFFSENQRA